LLCFDACGIKKVVSSKTKFVLREQGKSLSLRQIKGYNGTMNRTHIILYIPGLGDHNLDAQQKALRLWKIYGVNTEICPIHWLVDEPWGTKLQRVLDKIDYYSEQGKIVSLVGISAGSTATLQALVLRRNKIHKTVLVCPKFQSPETIHPLRYEMNPAFKDAILRTVEILPSLTSDDKNKLRIYRPVYDNLLPAKESYIPGVKRSIMPAVTHIGGIAYAITLGSWLIVRFLKKSS
jgi:hypothetical protein